MDLVIGAGGYNPLIHRRDRSNSANNSADILDLSYMDFEVSSLDVELTASIKSNREHHTIRSLLLSNNLLSDLPSSIRSFGHIQILDLSSNHLKKYVECT